ncbi:MAG TPA: MATE family efflux transporter [Feifaniaceae bacterium]|nr:MATE family efflux transporter [Feifaniaceae bacterium]
MSTASENKETFIFESAPIHKAIATLAIPAIISQLVTMIYNLADTWYVGQLGDTRQMAAVTVAYPLFHGLTAIANMFGIGGGSLISGALGQKDYTQVKKISSFCFWSSIGLTAVAAMVVLFGGSPLLTLLGAGADTLPYVRDYILWTFIIGGIPTVLNMCLAHLVRATGASKQAGIGMAMGGILNIILDPLFIFSWGFGFGVKGAAIATCISNFIATCYFMVFIWRRRKENVISIHPKNYLCGKSTVGRVFFIGAPSALLVFLTVISNGVLNSLMSAYTSTAMAALGAVKKIDMVPTAVVQGLATGILPLLAYNYGSGNRKRMKATLKYSLVICVAFTSVCLVILEVFAPSLVRFFINVPETVGLGASFMRLHCIAMPFISLTLVLMAFFQATGQGGKALVLSLIRKGIIDVPLMFLMNALIPMVGLMTVQPMLDFLSAVIAVLMYLHFMKGIKAENRGQA